MTALAAAIDALDGSHPANDGAHRLAWWLCADDARWATLAKAPGMSAALIDCLLSGGVEPGEWVAVEIARTTAGAVRPEDWECGGPLGWADRPPARAS